MRAPTAIIKKAIDELQHSIDMQVMELDAYVCKQNESISNSKKILERLKEDLKVIQNENKIEYSYQKSNLSQTKVIQRNARNVLIDNGGSMKRMELIKILVIMGVKSRDPEQLIRRAISRDNQIESVDDIYFYVRNL